MASENSDSDVMVRWYRERIAEPTTDDEVYGYWVFVFGLLVGIFGILLYLSSFEQPTAFPAKAGIGLSAIALVLLMVGPVIRLPLASRASLVSYAGALVAFLSVLWFFMEYPGWRDGGMAIPIITLYSVGLVLIALGAAFVPVIRGSPKQLDQPAAGPAEPEPESTVEEVIEAAPESKARFELYEDRAGMWRWRLRHRNGNIIADGGQGYSSRQKARQGLESVQKNSPNAGIVQQDVETEEPEPPADEPYPAGESQGAFDVYEDASGTYRWRLVHDNGNIIADSGEGYSSRSEAENAVERVQGYVGDAGYLRIDPTAFEVYRDAAEEWRWRLLHRNGEILADSGEGYAERTGAQDGLESVRERVDEEDAVEVFEDAAGEYRWRLVTSSDEILADSGEGYGTESAARDAVGRFRKYAPAAETLDYTDAAFELYEDNAGEYRWRLLHENGQIIADSGQGYASRTGAIEGIQSVKRNAPTAEVDSDLDEEEADSTEDEAEVDSTENGAGADAEATENDESEEDADASEDDASEAASN
jgi:uncharacterized protein YegP (UPF0339 family)